MDDPQPNFDPMDPLTLLCERCGYVIEDLDPGGPCPECGKPIVESIQSRAGTPWQRKPCLRSLYATWWITARHPMRTLESLIIHDTRGVDLASALLAVGILTAVLIGSLPFLLVDLSIFLAVLAASVVFGLTIGWIVLFTLTSIEAIGLRYIARKRKMRLDWNGSWTLVAHGCAGWVISMMSIAFGAAAGIVIEGLSIRFTLDSAFTQLLIRVFVFGPIVLGIPAGFVFFELFAYLGLRRCKFRNHPARCLSSPTRSPMPT